MKVNLRWITPKADEEVGYIARVSNPSAKPDDPVEKLIQYLLNHKHWSPFEMACMCVEIYTTRDIARQILRHRSFHFQEFSQRYSVVSEEPEYSDARLQDHKNRQNSIPVEDQFISKEWASLQNHVWDVCWFCYQAALRLGIAKELARKLLPEGLTRTRMYMQGTLRDWLHYVGIRAGTETQLEHREIANAILHLIAEQAPIITKSALEAGVLPYAINLEPISTGPKR
jgi:thymidylate synthase (FAD)